MKWIAMVDMEWSLGVNQFLFELVEIETNTQHISQALCQLKSGVMEWSFREVCNRGKY